MIIRGNEKVEQSKNQIQIQKVMRKPRDHPRKRKYRAQLRSIISLKMEQ